MYGVHKHLGLCVYRLIYLMGWFPLLIQGAFSLLPPEVTTFYKLTEDSGKTKTYRTTICAKLKAVVIAPGFSHG